MSILTMNPYTVVSDLNVFRKELATHNPSFEQIYRLNFWHPILDITFDWALIIFVTYMGYLLGVVAYPFVIFIVANRQRALGNVLHDAGHQNLHRKKTTNDMIANLFLAPSGMADLRKYRDLHFKHHAKLGKTNEDPDYIFPPLHGPTNWCATYFSELFSLTNWIGSILGHVIKKEIDWRRRAYIGLWWIFLYGVLAVSVNSSFALYFIAIWFAARGTIFHMITTFREMCDHFGLETGGVYSFTRDIISSRLLCWIIHPHNNAYHLSHHLMPSVPYYKLRAAQKIFCKLPSYELYAHVCRSYFLGEDAVVHDSIRKSRVA